MERGCSVKIKAALTPELVDAVNDLSSGRAEHCIKLLDRIKNYFIYNWDVLPEDDDSVIKEFLTQMSLTQSLFSDFIPQEGVAE